MKICSYACKEATKENIPPKNHYVSEESLRHLHIYIKRYVAMFKGAAYEYYGNRITCKYRRIAHETDNRVSYNASNVCILECVM